MGSGGWNKGIPHSEETKQKMREKANGRLSHKKGRPNSEETRQRIRESKIGKRPNHNGMLGKKHSEESKRKMIKSHIGLFLGEKNPAWNGGSSFLPYSPDWTDELKQFIKNRDNNECQNPYCNGRTKRLDVHHINYNKQDCSQFNLITLCRSCNVKSNTDREEWKRFYKRIIWGKYL